MTQQELTMHTKFSGTIAFVGLLATLSSQAFAQSGHAHHPSQGAAAVASPTTKVSFSEGVVRRVNLTIGTVTIAHGPLPHLDMPPMTMGFKVVGGASVDGLAAGDKVRFVADKDGGSLVVTRIEKLPN